MICTVVVFSVVGSCCVLLGAISIGWGDLFGVIMFCFVRLSLSVRNVFGMANHRSSIGGDFLRTFSVCLYACCFVGDFIARFVFSHGGSKLCRNGS